LVAVTLPDVLFSNPAVVPVTVTWTVHASLPEIDPPLKLTVVAPATGENVPPQLPATPRVLATLRPVGNPSVKAMPVSDVELGLVMLKAREVVPFKGMVNAPKALLMIGGASTVRMAVLLVRPVPPSVDVTAPVVLL
jgi:hypothetical protein